MVFNCRTINYQFLKNVYAPTRQPVCRKISLEAIFAPVGQPTIIKAILNFTIEINRLPRWGKYPI